MVDKSPKTIVFECEIETQTMEKYSSFSTYLYRLN